MKRRLCTEIQDQSKLSFIKFDQYLQSCVSLHLIAIRKLSNWIFRSKTIPKSRCSFCRLRKRFLFLSLSSYYLLFRHNMFFTVSTSPIICDSSTSCILVFFFPLLFLLSSFLSQHVLHCMYCWVNIPPYLKIVGMYRNRPLNFYWISINIFRIKVTFFKFTWWNAMF